MTTPIMPDNTDLPMDASTSAFDLQVIFEKMECLLSAFPELDGADMRNRHAEVIMHIIGDYIQRGRQLAGDLEERLVRLEAERAEKGI